MASLVALTRKASTTRANGVRFASSGEVAIASQDKGFIDLSRDQRRGENDSTCRAETSAGNDITTPAVGHLADGVALNEDKDSVVQTSKPRLTDTWSSMSASSDPTSA